MWFWCKIVIEITKFCIKQNAPAGSDTLFHIIISEQTCLKTIKSQFREDPHFMFCIADH